MHTEYLCQSQPSNVPPFWRVVYCQIYCRRLSERVLLEDIK
jgi:hypothetical protein